MHFLHALICLKAVALEGINASFVCLLKFNVLIGVGSCWRVCELVMLWFTLKKKKTVWEWQFRSKEWEREKSTCCTLEVMKCILPYTMVRRSFQDCTPSSFYLCVVCEKLILWKGLSLCHVICHLTYFKRCKIS